MDKQEKLTSPVIAKPKSDKTMDFYDALRKVAEGHKVTKREWDNKKVYGYLKVDPKLKEPILMLHKEDGDHAWIINEGDLMGTDYFVL
jgi:hypothetical protein